MKTTTDHICDLLIDVFTKNKLTFAALSSRGEFRGYVDLFYSEVKNLVNDEILAKFHSADEFVARCKITLALILESTVEVPAALKFKGFNIPHRILYYFWADCATWQNAHYQYFPSVYGDDAAVFKNWLDMQNWTRRGGLLF